MSQLVAITGSSGILGTAVIRLFLTGTKYQLLLIDKAPPNDSEDIKRLKRENGEGRLTESTCDLSDYGALEKVLRSHQENNTTKLPTAIIHLANIPNPIVAPPQTVYSNNTVSSYNILLLSSLLPIPRVVIASSINALGAAFHPTLTHQPRDQPPEYFPIDESHPISPADPYALSKAVVELQADSMARGGITAQNENAISSPTHGMKIASLRFHHIVDEHDQFSKQDMYEKDESKGHWKDLWGYVLAEESARACLLAIEHENPAGGSAKTEKDKARVWNGHEVFYIVAPEHSGKKGEVDSKELAERFYDHVMLRKGWGGMDGFWDCQKAGKMLGWWHERKPAA